MPSLSLTSMKDTKEILSDKEKSKDQKPIAIIKGDETNPAFNSFLTLNINDKKVKGKKHIYLPEDLMFQILPSPDPKARDIFYIAGASGSGKSYQAKIIINNYKKLFPKRRIYLISKLEEDETLDELKFIERVDTNEFLEQEYDINKAEPALMVFDDFETLKKPVLDAIMSVVSDIATTGRHFCVSMIYISHQLSDYKRTRLILHEATRIIIFPQNTSNYILGYLLKNYTSLDKKVIPTIKKMGRWACVNKHYPNYVLSQSSGFAGVDDDRD